MISKCQLLLLLILIGVAAMAQAQHSQAVDMQFPSQDCALPDKAPQSGATRIFIALHNGQDGSGKSMAGARDGSTAAAFDKILRCYSEGCSDPNNPQASVAKVENLVVCIGPGTFSTMGTYDYVINVPHTNPVGFTIGK